MVTSYSVFIVALISMVAMVPAQRSPYAGSSDPGVLPQYLPEGSENRFGSSGAAGGAKPEEHSPPPLHSGTLETEDVYNRVSEWPDAHKPFWYLNAVAIQKQREQQQQQQQAQAQQAQNRPIPFAAGSRARLPSGRQQN